MNSRSVLATAHGSRESRVSPLGDIRQYRKLSLTLAEPAPQSTDDDDEYRHECADHSARFVHALIVTSLARVIGNCFNPLPGSVRPEGRTRLRYAYFCASRYAPMVARIL
jgi:hypothetical protein